MTVVLNQKKIREREFERLYRESFETVYGWVRARMASDEDAQDVVSEAYMNAARSFDSFDPSRAKFGTWVTAIARNCMISHFRKQRASVAIDDVSEAVFSVAGEQDAVDDRLLVKKILACLNDEERELIALKYRDDMKNVEIAAELGMNPSTVATKIARALAKVHQTMGADFR